MKETAAQLLHHLKIPALIIGGIAIAAAGVEVIHRTCFTAIANDPTLLEAETELPTEPPTTAAPTTVPTTEPTTVATTTAPPPPPEEVLLDIPYYSQQGLLSTGCELISAKMVLEQYTGEEVPVQDIIDHMYCTYPTTIDGLSYAPHPEEAFIGSPWDPTSFGCFAPVLSRMMNELLPAGETAVDTTGTPLRELAETWLPQGRPVIIWATIAMLDHFDYLGWYLLDKEGEPTGVWYDWQANEHCLVLVGYDEDYYYFNDPYTWRAQTSYRRELVEERFESMGSYSIVVMESDLVETTASSRTTRHTTTTTTTTTTTVTDASTEETEELTAPPMPTAAETTRRP